MIMLEKNFDFKNNESLIYKSWDDGGAFACDPQSSRQPFTIMMPPPNVTGTLHLGHALTYTLEDILVRYKRLQGFDALWQPGTDHAGIATQMVVERQLAAEGLSRQGLGREKFLERVWAWKEESGNTIVHQQRRLGISPDWKRSRFTLDEGLSKAVAKVFVTLHEQGLIYRDKRLVNWDTKFQTAISDLEVINTDTKGHLWYIRYPFADNPDEFITVATTRPETMFGDTAVAVHPDDARYQAWIGRSLKLPLTDRTIPLIADEYCDQDKGSGAVKITPAHDFNDFDVGRRHDLPMINVLDRFGMLNDQVPMAYQGLNVDTARKQVIDELDAQGLLEKIDPIQHTVPIGDRSGVMIQPWLTDQWYVDAKTLAKPAIEAVENGDTVFVPEHWSATYFEWLRNIQPWCISRQLWWGHQIPAWYGPDGQVFVAESVEEAQEKARALYENDVELTRDTDVLDTWFSSALWPFSTLGWPEKTPELDRYYPTDVLDTGFDIIFFWVARMMMMGLHFTGKVPFKTVYIHALVRDQQGQKMSKSKGNIIDPLEILDQYGCDAVRFTLAALAAPGRDIKLGNSRIEGYRNFITKIWNAARFLEMNECQAPMHFDPASCHLELNRWIVSEVLDLAQTIQDNLEIFRFNDAAAALYQFLWGTYCDYYLEFLKPIFLEKSAACEESRQTAAWAFREFLKMASPFIPFVTESLWREFAPKVGFLMNQSWPRLDASLRDEKACSEMRWIIDVIAQIRSLRAEFNVSPGIQLTLSTPDLSQKDILNRHESLILRLARLTDIRFGETHEKAVTFVAGQTPFALLLGDNVDLNQEIIRLKKEVQAHDDEIHGYEKRLSNPEFRQKAKPEVVEELEERIEALQLAKSHKEMRLTQLQ